MYDPRTLQISSFCMYSYSYKAKRHYDEPYSRKQNIKERNCQDNTQILFVLYTTRTTF